MAKRRGELPKSHHLALKSNFISLCRNGFRGLEFNINWWIILGIRRSIPYYPSHEISQLATFLQYFFYKKFCLLKVTWVDILGHTSINFSSQYHPDFIESRLYDDAELLFVVYDILVSLLDLVSGAIAPPFGEGGEGLEFVAPEAEELVLSGFAAAGGHFVSVIFFDEAVVGGF